MSKKNPPVWVTVIAVIGLAAALSIVIHSLATGDGIHTLALAVGLLLMLQLLRRWRRRA